MKLAKMYIFDILQGSSRKKPAMPAPANQRQRVPLTKFRSSTAQYLDAALRNPIILTAHGRKRHIVAESDYFERLEHLAHNNLLEAMDLTAHHSSDMPEDMRARILATQPTDEEVASGKWND